MWFTPALWLNVEEIGLIANKYLAINGVRFDCLSQRTLLGTYQKVTNNRGSGYVITAKTVSIINNNYSILIYKKVML